MPRPTLRAALVLCAFPLACGVTPEREYGELVGSGGAFDDDPDPDLVVGDAQADPARNDAQRRQSGDDRSLADSDDRPGDVAGVVSLPELTCPDSVCVEGGRGGIDDGPLVGRDLVREAFMGVAGFTDADTYESHTEPDSANVAYRGVVGEVSAALAGLNALLAEGGVPTCDDVPVGRTMSLQSAPGIKISFNKGRSAPPSGHAGQNALYQKEIVMLDGSGASARVELNCGVAQGHARLRLLEDGGEFAEVELTWDDSDPTRRKLDLMSASAARGERVAMHFETDDSEYVASIARSRARSRTRHAGLRVLLRGDSVDQLATAFVHEIAAQPQLHLADGARARDLSLVADADYACVDFAGGHPLQGSGDRCEGLDLSAPVAPIYDALGSYSVHWVAAPSSLRASMVRAFSDAL